MASLSNKTFGVWTLAGPHLCGLRAPIPFALRSVCFLADASRRALDLRKSRALRDGLSEESSSGRTERKRCPKAAQLTSSVQFHQVGKASDTFALGAADLTRQRCQAGAEHDDISPVADALG